MVKVVRDSDEKGRKERARKRMAHFLLDSRDAKDENRQQYVDDRTK